MTAIVVTRSAQMPSSCRGQYAKVAVLDVHYRLAFDPEYHPAITERSRGVLRVVRVWDRLNVGKTERCAYRIALAEAERLAREYNSAGDVATADLLISTGSA